MRRAVPETIAAAFIETQAQCELVSGYGMREILARREPLLDEGALMEAQLAEALNAVAGKYGKRMIFSTHPRTRARIEKECIALNPLIETLKPLGFSDYNKLQMNAKAVLSDSGTITEESSILNFPALNIRDAHERPEGMEEGSVMMVGTGKVGILRGLQILESQPRGEDRLLRLVADYSQPNVSEKVLRILHSYVDYVNRTVWWKL